MRQFRVRKGWIDTSKPGDIVGQFVCVRQTNTQPSDDSPDWTRCIAPADESLIGPPGKSIKGDSGEPGIVWRGAFSPRTTYTPGQAIEFEGSSFVCVREVKGRVPDSSTAFELMAKRGLRGLKGDDGISQRGRKGADGRDGISTGFESISAIADATMSKGFAVFSSSPGHINRAVASTANGSAVVGLLASDVESGGVATYQTEGKIARLDGWAGVANSDWLVEGHLYYLSATNPGQITSVAPATVGQYVVVIGRATSEDSIDIELATSILL